MGAGGIAIDRAPPLTAPFLSPRTPNTKHHPQHTTQTRKFYAPWCGHCQALTPAWAAAAKALKGIVNVAAVDCDAHKEVAAKHGVRGFPTIKFFYVQGGAVKSVDYSGGRDAPAIVGFAMDKARKAEPRANKLLYEAEVSMSCVRARL